MGTLLLLTPIAAPLLAALVYALAGWRRATAHAGTAAAVLILAAGIALAVRVTRCGTLATAGGYMGGKLDQPTDDGISWATPMISLTASGRATRVTEQVRDMRPRAGRTWSALCRSGRLQIRRRVAHGHGRGQRRPVAWTSGHHVRHWIDGGETSVANGALLCHRCHVCVHEGGFRLVRRPDRTWTAVRDPLPP